MLRLTTHWCLNQGLSSSRCFQFIGYIIIILKNWLGFSSHNTPKPIFGLIETTYRRPRGDTEQKLEPKLRWWFQNQVQILLIGSGRIWIHPLKKRDPDLDGRWFHSGPNPFATLVHRIILCGRPKDEIEQKLEPELERWSQNWTLIHLIGSGQMWIHALKNGSGYGYRIVLFWNWLICNPSAQYIDDVMILM